METALNRWTRVAPLDLDKAAQDYAVVEALELLALELTFVHLTPGDLSGLSDANRRMRAAAQRHDPAAAVIADERFHDLWISKARNGTLAAILGHLKSKLRRFELAYFDAASRGQESFQEHAAIINALKRRSFPAARTALRRNWRGSVARLRMAVEKRAPIDISQKEQA